MKTMHTDGNSITWGCRFLLANNPTALFRLLYMTAIIIIIIPSTSRNGIDKITKKIIISDLKYDSQLRYCLLIFVPAVSENNYLFLERSLMDLWNMEFCALFPKRAVIIKMELLNLFVLHFLHLESSLSLFSMKRIAFSRFKCKNFGEFSNNATNLLRTIS